MTRATSFVVATALLATAALSGQGASGGQAAPASGIAGARSLLDTYCAGCHSPAAKAGGLVIEPSMLSSVRERRDVWEKSLRKLRGRQMPPPGSRQPSQAEIDRFVTWLEANHPDDVAQMLGAEVGPNEVALMLSVGERRPNLSQESIDLWRQHVNEFVEDQTSG